MGDIMAFSRREDEVNQTPPSVLILYGSETGNGQDLAEDLERLFERLHYDARAYEMNDVDLAKLEQYFVVVFVISTTGQGEIPKNATRFWKSLLRSRLPPSYLANVRFTTFGLGDSSYSKFNWAARKLHKRVEQLGGIEFFRRGEADDQHDDGIEGTYIPWIISLRNHMMTAYPIPGGLAPIPPETTLPPRFTLYFDNELGLTDSAATTLKNNDLYPEVALDGLRVSEKWDDVLGDSKIIRPHEDLLPIPNSWAAKTEKNSRVTPRTHWQDVRSFTVTVTDSSNPSSRERQPVYKPGDVVIVYPKNFPDDVQELIDLMGWHDVADRPRIRHGDRKERSAVNGAPSGCYPLEHTTLRQLLTHNYDITAIPQRKFFDYIKVWTDDSMHKERLAEFADPRYSDEFWDYTSRPRRSIVEVLQEFSSVRIPWQSIPSVFPVIRGRQYSIASGGSLVRDPRTQKTRIEILVALVKYKTVLRKIRRGLCSRYLESLQPDTDIRIVLEAHKGPPIEEAAAALPVLAIGPGTGVAPMRALFHYRATNKTTQRGKDVLFFGARNRNADFYYEKEWLDLGVDVYTAFSRDQREKIYVQDVIRREAALVCSLLRQRAIVCMCGSAGKMPQAVRLALQDALVQGGLVETEEEARAFLEKRMKVNWWEELW